MTSHFETIQRNPSNYQWKLSTGGQEGGGGWRCWHKTKSFMDKWRPWIL